MFARRLNHLESKIILTAINNFNHTRLQLRFEIYALSFTPAKVVELARLFCVMLRHGFSSPHFAPNKEARGLKTAIKLLAVNNLFAVCNSLARSDDTPNSILRCV